MGILSSDKAGWGWWWQCPWDHGSMLDDFGHFECSLILNFEKQLAWALGTLRQQLRWSTSMGSYYGTMSWWGCTLPQMLLCPWPCLPRCDAHVLSVDNMRIEDESISNLGPIRFCHFSSRPCWDMQLFAHPFMYFDVAFPFISPYIGNLWFHSQSSLHTRSLYSQRISMDFLCISTKNLFIVYFNLSIYLLMYSQSVSFVCQTCMHSIFPCIRV